MKRFALLLLSFVLIQTVAANAFMETQAWKRHYSLGTLTATPGAIDVDSSGNTYALFETGANGYTYQNLAALDYKGNQIFNTQFYLSGGTASSVKAFTVGSTHQELVTANLANGGGYAGMFNAAGTALWSHTYPGPVTGFDVDSSGNSFLAVNQTYTDNSLGAPNQEVTFLDLNNKGVVVNTVSVPDFYALTAVHVGHNWTLGGFGGRDTQAIGSDGGGRWGVYPDTSITPIISGFTAAAYGPYQSFLADYAIPYADGSVLVQQNTDGGVVGANGISYSTNLKYYSGSGGLQWETNVLSGALNAQFSNVYLGRNVNVTPVGPGQSIYVYSNGTVPFVQQLLSTGSPNWYSKGMTFDAAADTGGVYIVQMGSSANSLELVRFDTSGNNVFDYIYNGDGSGTASHIGSKLVSGYLYVADKISYSTGNYIVIQRFVPGITLNALTPSASSVAPGNSITLKVQLDAAAPGGGLPVSLSSNSQYLLFPNNTTSYSFTVPAGSLYANVTLHAPIGSPATAVQVTGENNGVLRYAKVYVQ